jgi:Uma2 family endonuclease
LKDPAMSFLGVRKGDITFDEFLDLSPDGEKADLLDGVIYVASPDNTVAADLNGWLYSLLYTYVEVMDLGKAYVSRVAFRIGPKQGPEPDIGFVPKELEFTRRRGYIDGPPALAVEIVSPDSVSRDYIQKRAIYEKAGVREYWIIDPDAKRTTFLRLREGRFKTVTPAGHIFHSQVLPGFFLDVRWLWRKSRPKAYDVVRQLLESKRQTNAKGRGRKKS